MITVHAIKRAQALLASVLVAVPLAAGAHHSIAAFDLKSKKTLTLNVRNGWKYGDVKAGDQVTVEINPAKDPNVHAGSMRRITFPDGRVIAGPREFLVVPDSEKTAE